MVRALVLMNKPQISTSSDGIPSMKPPIKCLPEISYNRVGSRTMKRMCSVLQERK